MEIGADAFAHPRLSTVGEVRRALHPLQAQADRVGRQVEEFAETLDRLSSIRKEAARDSSKILPIVQRYEKIAHDTVTRLKRRHNEDKKRLLRDARRKESRDGSSDTTLALYDQSRQADGVFSENSTSVRDLLHWEQERQTWELLGLMLQVHYPRETDTMTSDYTPVERPRDLPVHQYSSNHSVYQKYLATNDDAWERHVILEWLGRSADESRESVEDAVEELSSHLGTGSAAHGWLHSKEAVKAEKRLRSLLYAVVPDQLGSNQSFGKSGKAKTVTQMDPDSFTRQGRELHPDDYAFEKATWLGCWELLRRGKSWSDIQDWCEQRHEGWRALSMRDDPRLGGSKESASGTLLSRVNWHQLCVRLAQSGGADEYERAVFGLLGGDELSIFKVCKTWEDHLHALISYQLSRGFNAFFREQFQLVNAGYPNGVSELTSSSIGSFLGRLETNAGKNDGNPLTPFRALQSAIIQNLPAPHFVNQGLEILPQLSSTQYSLLNLKTSRSSKETKLSLTSPISLDDHDMIRLLTHVLLTYQYMHSDLALTPAMENVVVAYIDFLGKAGKQQLLPLYASFLSIDRAATCLARQLPFIKDTTERQVVVRLMKQYGMEDEVVLLAQLEGIVAASPPESIYKRDFPILELLDTPGSEYKDVRPLRRELVGFAVEAWEEDLVDALEWFLLLDGEAKFLIYPAGIVVYKHLLRTKSYAAISRLAAIVNTARISQIVTLPAQANGHHADDPDMDGDAMVTDRTSGRQTELEMQSERENDRADMKVFQDLESFAMTLDVLDEWEKIVHAGTGARVQAHDGDKTALKVWKKELEAAHNSVVESMQPLLQGWLLPTRGKSDEEMSELRRMRVCMLPELVFAYLSVLSFAGTWLNRENLLECMNLAKEIANEEKDLCQVFVDAGRMAELMTTMASISRQILAAQETTGGLKMKKRRGGGELLDIWSVNADREG